MRSSLASSEIKLEEGKKDIAIDLYAFAMNINDFV
jgi:hypothetical protein